MSHHLSWETLNDFVDDRLASDARSSTAAHVLQCPSCRSQLDGLRRLTAAARDLPPVVTEAAGEDWNRLAQAIAAPRGATRREMWWQRPRALVAAACVLVAASSGLTVLAIREGGGAGPRDAALVTATEIDVQPVAWRAVEEDYMASVDELRALLETRRESLSPKTVAMVEQHLATIDVAIQEARSALLRDPANTDLANALATGYRHKVELLRRVTQLDERS